MKKLQFIFKREKRRFRDFFKTSLFPFEYRTRYIIMYTTTKYIPSLYGIKYEIGEKSGLIFISFISLITKHHNKLKGFLKQKMKSS